jgi:hypothetical protein
MKKKIKICENHNHVVFRSGRFVNREIKISEGQLCVTVLLSNLFESPSNV